MSIFFSFFYKILIYIGNKKQIYLFKVSKKFITSWGEKTYGYPVITCYDMVSRLSVGKYSSIASNVSILLGANHKRGLITTFPHSHINSALSPEETNEKGDVVIGNDVWIGYGVTIIGPVTIGDGAIVGAGAVVVNDIDPYAVAVGVPAKVVKYRFSQEEIKLLLDNPWWEKTESQIKKIESALYSSDVKGFIQSLKNVEF